MTTTARGKIIKDTTLTTQARRGNRRHQPPPATSHPSVHRTRPPTGKSFSLMAVPTTTTPEVTIAKPTTRMAQYAQGCGARPDGPGGELLGGLIGSGSAWLTQPSLK